MTVKWHEASTIIREQCFVASKAHLEFDDYDYKLIDPIEVGERFEKIEQKYESDGFDCENFALTAMLQFPGYLFGYVKIAPILKQHGVNLFISTKKRCYMFHPQTGKIERFPRDKKILFGLFG